MSVNRTRLRVLLAAVVALAAFVFLAAFPPAASADDWVLTGSGIRVKKSPSSTSTSTQSRTT